ncbi:unnamed protein product [Parascedosporium putredinis]|uniref:Uncharacterized protein n=1 Tax=Parascedosporium putredinis TaxID=1442378 RepID=A0A9P1HAT1_9PEZI|nr:unnamed protein product [Parascedosporium putredinis]CAI8003187.1 unnamed protein product [Parascedosporium putredinis]
MSQRFLINPSSDNCQWTEPKARFGFVTQLSDKQVWTVTITRSKRGVRREYLSASGSSMDACFIQLLTLSSQAAAHHINNQGFNYPTEFRIHAQANAEGDDGSSGEEQASAPVSDDESDWGEDDCEGPASFGRRPPKPRPACLLINVLGGPSVASVLTEVLPSQKEIEKKARLLVEERGLDSHVDEKASQRQCLTIAKVSFTAALENQYDLEHFGDDLSALFSIMNNGLPHFSIDVKYSELP